MSKRKPVRVVETPVAERDPRPPVEAIRAAAFTQFAERGYPVVTVRDIMKACGLTQGALYNHFKSKDELLHDIIASTQGELERQCQQAVAGAGDDPRAKLAAFVRVYVVRHCRLRVEALVANREISWLGAERVADGHAQQRANARKLDPILGRYVAHRVQVTLSGPDCKRDLGISPTGQFSWTIRRRLFDWLGERSRARAHRPLEAIAVGSERAPARSGRLGHSDRGRPDPTRLYVGGRRRARARG